MANPVVMVHGWGGSFKRTWQEPGWEALLQDGGREVIGVDLLGHGTNDKPHDVESYLDLTPAITAAIAGHDQIDAVGFSMGAMTLLALACREPDRFGRLVLCGVGNNVLEEREGNEIAAALRGEPTDDRTAQLFVQYAEQPGNDREALLAAIEAERPRLTKEQLAKVSAKTLVVIGDKDFAGPGEPLAEAIPGAQLKVLRNVDHFATTEDFGCIDAVLAFLDAQA
ncbi:MAG: alpha/beta fold hydrolase [Acidimicrobiia bacterium]